MKTPEEIKRGLFICSDLEGNCPYCPYAKDRKRDPEGLCVSFLANDALAYTLQLEQDNAQKDERIRQLEREKDQAMADLAATKNCKVCKYFSRDASEEPCWSCGIAQRSWEWRGVEEEA